jgi:hypothetical protein
MAYSCNWIVHFDDFFLPLIVAFQHPALNDFRKKDDGRVLVRYIEAASPPSPVSSPQMRCVDHFAVTHSYMPRPITTLLDPIRLAATRKGYDRLQHISTCILVVFHVRVGR